MQYEVLSQFRSDGNRHMPGDIVELFGDQADRLVKTGVVKALARPFSGVLGTAPTMSENVSDLVGRIELAAQELKARISHLDTCIDEAFHRRDAILKSPMSKADFMAYVRADIRRLGEAHRSILVKMVGNSTLSYPNFDLASSRNQAQFSYLTGDSIEMASLPGQQPNMTREAFFWYFGDIIEQRFQDALSGMQWANDVMPVDQRRAVVAEIDGEIAAFRKERDELADQLIQAGIAG